LRVNAEIVFAAIAMETFRLKILITGPTPEEAKAGLQWLADELHDHTWLLDPTTKLVGGQITVELGYGAKTFDFARRAVSDEMCDCVVATIRSSGGVHVHVVRHEPETDDA